MTVLAESPCQSQKGRYGWQWLHQSCLKTEILCVHFFSKLPAFLSLEKQALLTVPFLVQRTCNVAARLCWHIPLLHSALTESQWCLLSTTCPVTKMVDALALRCTFYFLFISRVRDHTQGLLPGRQAFYHWATAPVLGTPLWNPSMSVLWYKHIWYCISFAAHGHKTIQLPKWSSMKQENGCII